jgi:hypothetical protein
MLFEERERVYRFIASFDTLSKIPALFNTSIIVITLNKVMGTKYYKASIALGYSSLFTNILVYKRYITIMRNIFSKLRRIS